MFLGIKRHLKMNKDENETKDFKWRKDLVLMCVVCANLGHC